MKNGNRQDQAQRSSGILCHISSLPSQYGIGDFGDGAYQFVDFLVATKQRYWQILPLNPTSIIMGNSPYASISAFAGNPLFISPNRLVSDGFLLSSEIVWTREFGKDDVDYENVAEYKQHITKAAFTKFQSKILSQKIYQEFEKFDKENSDWLDDYSLFATLKEEFQGVVWSQWPCKISSRETRILDSYREKLREKILCEKFSQYLFFKQWDDLKEYCRSNDILIIGDISIYVSYDGCDVWVNPEIFNLSKDLQPKFVAGVPPDYFSATGQLWGNPVYDWAQLKKSDYKWWLKRLEQNLKISHCLRLDHFRGFVGFWEVPFGDATAVGGHWKKAPAEDFFSKILKRFPEIKIIAEDLGVMTDQVRAIMAKYQFPGMKLLLFAFDGQPSKNPYIPHNVTTNSIMYTGTHDNNTVRGWFEKDARQEDRERVCRYFGREIASSDITWEFIRLAMMSVSNTCIFPLQDVLNLGAEGRMNTPATVGKNWRWRFQSQQLSNDSKSRLSEFTYLYGRA